MATEDAIRVTPYVSGYLSAAAGFWREGDSFDHETVLPVPAYLIEVGEHRILFDTGLHPEAGPGRYGPVFEAMGFELPAAPPDVKPTEIVLSHLHFDHAGGLYAYPGVPVLLQRAEWDAAGTIANPDESPYQPVDYAAAEKDLQLLDGEYDILGDGRLVVRPLPGHTPGSQGLIVKLDDGRTAIFVADACYFPENIDSERLPPYTWNSETERQSLRWLRDQRDAGAVIVCGHDSAAGTFSA